MVAAPTNDLPYGSIEWAAQILNATPDEAAATLRRISDAAGGERAARWLTAEVRRVRAEWPEGDAALDPVEVEFLCAVSAHGGAAGEVDAAGLTFGGQLGTDGEMLEAVVLRAEWRETLQRRDGGRVWQLRAWPPGPDAAPTR